MSLPSLIVMLLLREYGKDAHIQCLMQDSFLLFLKLGVFAILQLCNYLSELMLIKQEFNGYFNSRCASERDSRDSAFSALIFGEETV